MGANGQQWEQRYMNGSKWTTMGKTLHEWEQIDNNGNNGT
jgi:hypothetical protein